MCRILDQNIIKFLHLRLGNIDTFFNFLMIFAWPYGEFWLPEISLKKRYKLINPHISNYHPPSDLALEHVSWWLPCWVSRGYLDSFRQHTKLSPTFSPYSTPIRWVLVRLVFYPFKEFRLRYSQKFLLWSGDICYDNYKIRHTMIKLRKKKKKERKILSTAFLSFS